MIGVFFDGLSCSIPRVYETTKPPVTFSSAMCFSGVKATKTTFRKSSSSFSLIHNAPVMINENFHKFTPAIHQSLAPFISLIARVNHVYEFQGLSHNNLTVFFLEF